MSEQQLPIIGPKQRTPEWYALRRNPEDPRFGGTDAAGLVGLSKWKSPRHIYEEFFTEQEQLDNEAMKIGRVMERPIQELYADFNDRTVVNEMPTFLHPTMPLFASLDSVSMDKEHYEHIGVLPFSHANAWVPHDVDAHALEVKWSMSPTVASQLGEEGSDWVPNEWACQVQQQMDVAGLEVAEIAVFLFGRLKVYRVPKNNDLIDAIHDAAQEMRERIVNRDPPEPDWQHELTPELVRSMRHDIVGNTIDCTNEAAELWRQQKDLAAAITQLTKERDALKAQFEYWMITHSAAAGVLPDGIKQVVRREQSRAGYTVEPKTFWELREMKVK